MVRALAKWIGTTIFVAGLSWNYAFGDAATIVISDLEETPITATIANSVLLNNGTITAPKDTPEILTFSIASDGTVATLGRGIAIMTDSAGISDILDVTTSAGTRGGGIKFVQVAGTFTSDSETPLSLEFLNLDAATLKKIMDNAVPEDGSVQDLGAKLINIDTSPGDALAIISTITAASDVEPVPEPSSFTLLALALAVMQIPALRQRWR